MGNGKAYGRRIRRAHPFSDEACVKTKQRDEAQLPLPLHSSRDSISQKRVYRVVPMQGEGTPLKETKNDPEQLCARNTAVQVKEKADAHVRNAKRQRLDNPRHQSLALD